LLIIRTQPQQSHKELKPMIFTTRLLMSCIVVFSFSHSAAAAAQAEAAQAAADAAGSIEAQLLALGRQTDEEMAALRAGVAEQLAVDGVAAKAAQAELQAKFGLSRPNAARSSSVTSTASVADQGAAAAAAAGRPVLSAPPPRPSAAPHSAVERDRTPRIITADLKLSSKATEILSKLSETAATPPASASPRPPAPPSADAGTALASVRLRVQALPPALGPSCLEIINAGNCQVPTEL
jgi:hypothetical protein